MQQDILRLDIPVYHIVAMGVVQCCGDRPRDRQNVVDRDLLLAVQTLPERLPFDEGHDIVEEAAGRTRIEERQDVRVLELRCNLDLAEKPLGTNDGGQLRAEHLERHLAMMFEVLGEVYDCHSAAAQFAAKPVPIGDRGAQAIRQLGQWRRSVDGEGRKT